MPGMPGMPLVPVTPVVRPRSLPGRIAATAAPAAPMIPGGERHEWHRNRSFALTKLNINKDKVESLAKALAVGDSVAAWAEVNDVPRRTAYRWAAEAG